VLKKETRYAVISSTYTFLYHFKRDEIRKRCNELMNYIFSINKRNSKYYKMDKHRKWGYPENNFNIHSFQSFNRQLFNVSVCHIIVYEIFFFTVIFHERWFRNTKVLFYIKNIQIINIHN